MRRYGGVYSGSREVNAFSLLGKMFGPSVFLTIRIFPPTNVYFLGLGTRSGDDGAIEGLCSYLDEYGEFS